MTTRYMAVGDNGRTLHGLTHPRKDICSRMGVKHANKMYRDTKDGGSVHVGYVIGGVWWDVYRVLPFKSGDGKEK